MSILVIKSSILADQSQSNKLIDEYLAVRSQQVPSSVVVVRDVVSDPVPHLDGERMAAFATPEDQRTEAQRETVAYSDSLIDEIRNADEIVLGLPMYNFGVSSQFKAYMDHLARAGVTFKYTENGPLGLLEDRPVTVIATRGGVYADTPQDHQTDYVKQFLAFIGITSVQFVYAEKLGLGPDAVAESLSTATTQLKTLAA